jgi:1,4-dihydroxy-6-naphthoate synthase
VRRDVSDADAREIGASIRRSLEFAREHEGEIIAYVRAHAFEMDDAVMRAHIGLYVNEYSEDLGDAGMAAVIDFFARAERAGLIPAGTRPEFV